MGEKNETLDGDLRVRVNQEDLDMFITEAPVRTGQQYQVLTREFITAFNDGRLRIKPTEAQIKALKSNEELYNVD